MAEKIGEKIADPLKSAAATVPDAKRNPSKAERDWEEKTLKPTLEKSPERPADFTTVSSYPIKRLYTAGGFAWMERGTRFGLSR